MSKTTNSTSTTEYYVNGTKVVKSFFEKTYKKCVSLVPMSFNISKERKKTGEVTYIDTYNLTF